MVFKCDLSIVIPARNEMFVSNTVNDIVTNMRANTEVIVVLDEKWADPGIPQHERVSIVYMPQAVGQRAATNMGAKIAAGEYIMKVDAHCAFGEGFDKILLEDITPDVTMVPLMKNLHAFDWVCSECGWRKYQGALPESGSCPECDSTLFKREIIWKPKRKTPHSTSYLVSPQLEFDYWGGYKTHQKGDIVETFSLQGSCWMAHKDKYWGLKLCDEDWGSWGGQGAEVALKTWLSGGRVLVNKKTWYAHMFRTGHGFSFPYPNPGSAQKRAKDTLRDTFLSDKWEHQIHPLSWLIEKFWPIPGWTEGDLNNLKKKPKKKCKHKKPKKKGILYYTDNRLDEKYALPVRRQLDKSALPIFCSARENITNWDVPQLITNKEPGYATMFEQILAGLNAMKQAGIDVVFFAEHDVLYHLSHFDFLPQRDDTFYYNQNVWKVHAIYGFGLHYLCNQTSGLCANIDLLIDHYKNRIKYIQDNNTNDKAEYDRMIRKIGFEPGTHGRISMLNGRSEAWFNEKGPNIDIRRDKGNLTQSRWWKHQFRNQKFTDGWMTSDTIPEWGKTLLRFDEFLSEV